MLWLILGLVLGALFFFLATNGSFKMKWYEWALAVLGVVLILFALQNYNASLLEYEPRAAGYLLMIFGLPGIILAVLAGVLAFMRNRKVAS